MVPGRNQGSQQHSDFSEFCSQAAPGHSAFELPSGKPLTTRNVHLEEGWSGRGDIRIYSNKSAPLCTEGVGPPYMHVGVTLTMKWSLDYVAWGGRASSRQILGLR